MKYFYARVSTKEQNLARQLEVAKLYADIPEANIYCDKQSGRSFDRAAYEKLKAVVVAGDEVIVKELDRLGRNKEKLKEELDWFKRKGVILRILDIPTTLREFEGEDWIRDMLNTILIEVIAAFAEQEVNKTRKRQAEGIAAMPVVNGKKLSRKTGRYVGHPEVNIPEEVLREVRKRQVAGEISVEEAYTQLGVSRGTYFKKIKELAVA